MTYSEIVLRREEHQLQLEMMELRLKKEMVNISDVESNANFANVIGVLDKRLQDIRKALKVDVAIA